MVEPSLSTLLALAIGDMLGDSGPVPGSMLVDQFLDSLILLEGPGSLERFGARGFGAMAGFVGVFAVRDLEVVMFMGITEGLHGANNPLILQ